MRFNLYPIAISILVTLIMFFIFSTEVDVKETIYIEGGNFSMMFEHEHFLTVGQVIFYKIEYFIDEYWPENDYIRLIPKPKKKISIIGLREGK